VRLETLRQGRRAVALNFGAISHLLKLYGSGGPAPRVAGRFAELAVPFLLFRQTEGTQSAQGNTERNRSTVKDRLRKGKPRRHSSVGAATIFGLAVLALVDLVPVYLVFRQALAPEADSVAWPLHWWPSRLSLANLSHLWQGQPLVGNVLLSLFVASLTTFFSLALGVPAGWAAARLRQVESATPTVAILSRVLPPIAIAVPLTSLLIPLHLYNHPLGLGLVLAHLTIGIPVAILLSYAGFRDLPRELEEAAYVDGAGTLRTLLFVSLPATRGTVAAAAILIFLLSWDEFTYALLIQLTHRTLPPLIYYFTEYGELGTASALALLMLLPATLVILGMQRLIARGLTTGVVKG